MLSLSLKKIANNFFSRIYEIFDNISDFISIILKNRVRNLEFYG